MRLRWSTSTRTPAARPASRSWSTSTAPCPRPPRYHAARGRHLYLIVPASARCRATARQARRASILAGRGYVLAPPSRSAAGPTPGRSTPVTVAERPLAARPVRPSRQQRQATPPEEWRGMLSRHRCGARNQTVARVAGLLFRACLVRPSPPSWSLFRPGQMPTAPRGRRTEADARQHRRARTKRRGLS